MTPRLGSEARRTVVVTLYIGGVYAAAEPTEVRTLLGSCVAVALWDPETRIGGMNHFMLPGGDGGDHDPTRFGVHAMDCLVSAVMKLGGARHRLVAKCFGGGHVLDVAGGTASVPADNVAFALAYAAREGFVLATQDVGGTDPRQVIFHTGTGQAFVRRVRSARTRAQLAQDEGRRVAAPPAYGDVTFF